ncbi:hypothetical protein B0H15DRAFT_806620 [Mycena belliarum]|uniref:Ribonuclease H1 N-terminal domain-containing protein n=1 Tax=Mycena belliarum TaxID=1033014 RepID=A0AAD6TQU8_9AGAR|nr:hypothetical protein B0H15DRAFT_806620 [Mycena belliae]
MTPAEMVPDTQNPDHDPRFWCLPPIREDLTKPHRQTGGAPLHLVTEGRQVGIWRSWTVVQEMVQGYSGAAHRGHASVPDCIEEWQRHCILGAHPHPVDPALELALPLASETSPPIALALWNAASNPCGTNARRAYSQSPSKKAARPVEEGLQADLQARALQAGTAGADTGCGEAGRRAGEEDTEGAPIHASDLSETRPEPRAPATTPPPTTPGLEGAPAAVTPGPGTPPTLGAAPASPGPETLPPRSATPRPAAPRLGGATTAAPPPPRIIQRVVEKRPRHKKGEPPAKPGKVGWIWGTKLAFFEKRKDKWLLVAAKKDDAGKFYTQMAKLFLLKYGAIDDNEDLEWDVDDPNDEEADVVVDVVESQEGDNPEAVYYRKLRTRIGAWYRDQYSGLLQDSKAAFARLFTGALNQAPPKPMRSKITQYYSSKFYAERVKERVEARWASMQRRAKQTGEKLEAKIKLISDVTNEVWAEETPEFQEEVEVALERDYQAAVKAWEASLADSPTMTPEQFAATLANAAFYLKPFVDAIAERFGMSASLFICGPIGKKGGAIGVQSVHAGTTRGVAPVPLPQFDPVGFAEVEKVLIAFGKEAFSEADCKARALPGTSAPATTVAGVAPTAVATPVAMPSPAAILPPSIPVAPSNPVQPVSTELPPSTEELPRAMASAVPDAGPPTEVLPSEAATSHCSAANPTNATGGVADVVTGGVADVATGGVADVEMNEEEEGPSAAEVEDQIDTLWKRDDRALWSAELGRAHAAFERGKDWGIGWAAVVSNFFDFEGVHGYGTDGAQISTKGRPRAVKEWIARARNWNAKPALGRIGAQGLPGTFAGSWWVWWKGLQPPEREEVRGGLSCPVGADWSAMAELHGNNGLLQIMLCLLWWGDQVVDANPFTKNEWSVAVDDVNWVLVELLRPGIITGKKRKHVTREEDGSRHIWRKEMVKEERLRHEGLSVDEMQGT